MSKLLVGIGALVALTAGCHDELRYSLHYEQSGGAGGILEYRLQIDSMGRCTAEPLGLPGTRVQKLQLDEYLYHRLGILLDNPDLWSQSTVGGQLMPDAPHRLLIVRIGQRERRLSIVPPPSDAARPILSILDSIATSLLTTPQPHTKEDTLRQ